MPGAPPLGAVMDFAVYFWCIIISIMHILYISSKSYLLFHPLLFLSNVFLYVNIHISIFLHFKFALFKQSFGTAQYFILYYLLMYTYMLFIYIYICI